MPEQVEEAVRVARANVDQEEDVRDAQVAQLLRMPDEEEEDLLGPDEEEEDLLGPRDAQVAQLLRMPEREEEDLLGPETSAYAARAGGSGAASAFDVHESRTPRQHPSAPPMSLPSESDIDDSSCGLPSSPLLQRSKKARLAPEAEPKAPPPRAAPKVEPLCPPVSLLRPKAAAVAATAQRASPDFASQVGYIGPMEAIHRGGSFVALGWQQVGYTFPRGCHVPFPSCRAYRHPNGAEIIVHPHFIMDPWGMLHRLPSSKSEYSDSQHL